MSVADPTPHLTPRMRGPQGFISFRIGGGPDEPKRHLVDFDNEPVNLASADIRVTGKLCDPGNKVLHIPPSEWKLKAKNIHEVIAFWYPKGNEIVALGKWTLTVEMTVNGHHYDGGSFTLPCRENIAT